MPEDQEIVLTKTDSTNFQFTHSPMINAIHRLQIEFNVFLKKAMEQDLTDRFLEDLDFRVANERNLDIMLPGETGSGKSTLAMTIYYELWKRGHKLVNSKLKYSVDNICFTRTEWLEQNEGLLLGDTLIFDEDDQSRVGTGSLRHLEEQEKIEKTLRQSQFNYLFCSPLLEQHVEHYILKAFDMDFSRQLNRTVVMKRDEVGMVLPYGFIVLKRHVVDGYEAKKKKFRKAVQERTVNDRFREYDKVAGILMKKFSIDNKMKLRTKKSLIQRYFPRFVEEEVKEIMTSMELIQSGVKLDYPHAEGSKGSSKA